MLSSYSVLCLEYKGRFTGVGLRKCIVRYKGFKDNPDLMLL